MASLHKPAMVVYFNFWLLIPMYFSALNLKMTFVLHHHVRFSSNPNLKVRKTRFFAIFYYFLNMRTPSKRDTLQLSILLFTCIILIFLTGDIADWKKNCRFRNDRYMAGKNDRILSFFKIFSISNFALGIY